MKVWIVVLKVFGYMWIILGAIVIVMGIAGTWMKGGFSAVQELMSPFNIVNWVVMVITFAPGLGAMALAQILAEKQANVRGPSSNP